MIVRPQRDEENKTKAIQPPTFTQAGEKMVFTVEGQPIGKGRPRFVRATGHTYTPDKTREYEQRIAEEYTRAGGEIMNGYITVEIYAVYKIPTATSKLRKEQMLRGLIKPVVKPDIDNVIKIVLDGLNKVAYHDDKQVTKVVVTKAYGEEPYIEVKIENEL